MNSPPDVSIDAAILSWAEARCRLLYAGEQVAHRSCGIAVAETFGRRTEPYQALRRGGLTGHGMCGAVQAGVLVLGEVFGDPDPTAPATDELRAAATRYRQLWSAAQPLKGRSSIVCNDLTGGFSSFKSAARHDFCTDIASHVARCVAQTIVELGGAVTRLSPPQK